MLILTRRVGENLRVGDDVIISVLGVKGSQVRIGIDAPKHVQVHREEIYQRIQNEKSAASEKSVGVEQGKEESTDAEPGDVDGNF